MRRAKGSRSSWKVVPRRDKIDCCSTNSRVTRRLEHNVNRSIWIVFALVYANAYCTLGAQAPRPNNLQQADLAEIAAQIDELFVGKAVTATRRIGNETGTTVYYYPERYRHQADGTYVMTLLFRMVNQTDGQAPRVEFGEQIERLRWEGNGPVIDVARSNQPSFTRDVVQNGNGLSLHRRMPVPGESQISEWFRAQDGTSRGLQVYAGSDERLQWNEVVVPLDMLKMRKTSQP